jgi:hypothetical protein
MGSQRRRLAERCCVDFVLDTSGPVLAEGECFVIRGVRQVAWCKVTTPRGLNPARGAAAAQAMGAYIIDNVLQRRSIWCGVVFDVREGPSVFGPVTLAVLERVFERAELTKKRIATLVGPTAIQAEQFSAVSRSRAPRFATVTTEPHSALDWITFTG